MVEAGSSSEKRRRVRINFKPGPPRPTADEDLVAAGANPVPGWFLDLLDEDRVLGSWELWNPQDIPCLDHIKVLTIEQDMGALPGSQYIERAREQIRLLIPDLPAAHLDALTIRQLMAIGTKCFEVPGETRKDSTERKADAANPPGGERDSG